jgi:cytoskeleton protein RodZ
MMTGNAGALEVVVDGRPVGILGGDGQVRRNVSLDAERLVALLAASRD